MTAHFHAHTEGHRVLAVEDDPEAAEELRALLESRGDSVRIVATVEEALAALAEETFCYVILDQQLPTRAGDLPRLGGGECVMKAVRVRDPRRQGPFHTTPVLVLTGYSNHEDFVGKMYDLGASGFMSKPLRGQAERFLDKVSLLLERAKRVTHEDCAAHIVAEAPVASDRPRVEAPRAEAPRVEASAEERSGLGGRLRATSFDEITMKVIDGHTLLATCGEKRVHLTYADFGLITRFRVPSREWELLLDVCAGHGVFRWKKYGSFNNARQRIHVLRARLKETFCLDDDPFLKFRAVDGWRARFFASSDVAGDGDR